MILLLIGMPASCHGASLVFRLLVYIFDKRAESYLVGHEFWNHAATVLIQTAKGSDSGSNEAIDQYHPFDIAVFSLHIYYSRYLSPLSCHLGLLKIDRFLSSFACHSSQSFSYNTKYLKVLVDISGLILNFGQISSILIVHTMNCVKYN